MVALCALLAINGMATILSAHYGQQPDWTPHEKSRTIAKIHRWAGGFTLFFAGFTITGGIYEYSTVKNGGPEYLVLLGWLNIPVFYLAFLSVELGFRYWRRFTKVLVPAVTKEAEQKL